VSDIAGNGLSAVANMLSPVSLASATAGMLDTIGNFTTVADIAGLGGALSDTLGTIGFASATAGMLDTISFGTALSTTAIGRGLTDSVALADSHRALPPHAIEPRRPMLARTVRPAFPSRGGSAVEPATRPSFARAKGRYARSGPASPRPQRREVSHINRNIGVTHQARLDKRTPV
jgi:hypothetical protein